MIQSRSFNGRTVMFKLVEAVLASVLRPAFSNQLRFEKHLVAEETLADISAPTDDIPLM